jgi:hypothetical protein
MGSNLARFALPDRRTHRGVPKATKAVPELTRIADIKLNERD